MPALKPRKELAQFARDMERKLRANDHKGGWEGMSRDDMIKRLKEELAELEQASERHSTGECRAVDIISEAADVANFAMMIADNARSYAYHER